MYLKASCLGWEDARIWLEDLLECILPDFGVLLVSLGLFIVGFAVAWGWCRTQVMGNIEKAVSKAETEVQLLQQRLEQRQKELSELTESCGKIKEECQALSETNSKLEKEKAVLEERQNQAVLAEKKLLAKEASLEELRREISLLKEEQVHLKTRSEDDQKSAVEKLKILEDAKHELKIQFEALAGKIIEEKGVTIQRQNKETLESLLQPFRENLSSFRKRIDDIHSKESEDRAYLKKELHDLKKINETLNQEALNLTRALKGDKKKQGNWGELILKTVLEQSGLREGHEFETQVNLEDDNAKKMIPDVLIHLPDQKDIIVDSKVSLVNYEAYVSASSDEEQNLALKAHVDSIKQHIKSLSDKDYSNLKGVRSLDFVLMFIPVEPAFLAAFQYDADLFSIAFDRKIVIVTPTTLLATLRTVESIWRYEKQNRNTEEIARSAAKIYDKFRVFLEKFEDIGKELHQAQEVYDQARASLAHGKGNLIWQTERFKGLGVRVNKDIPATLREDFILEEGPSS